MTFRTSSRQLSLATRLTTLKGALPAFAGPNDPAPSWAADPGRLFELISTGTHAEGRGFSPG